jgi:hypothetical protein
MSMREASTEERQAFYRRYNKLPEASWAAVFQHLNAHERRVMRFNLASDDLEEAQARFKSIWLTALDTLDSLDVPDDSDPSSTAKRQLARVLQTMRASPARRTGA